MIMSDLASEFQFQSRGAIEVFFSFFSLKAGVFRAHARYARGVGAPGSDCSVETLSLHSTAVEAECTDTEFNRNQFY